MSLDIETEVQGEYIRYTITYRTDLTYVIRRSIDKYAPIPVGEAHRRLIHEIADAIEQEMLAAL